MNISSTTTDGVSLLLLSLQRICRNLSQLLNALDADVDSFERLLTQIRSSINESSSSSNNEDNENEDFYEKLCDEQLEPKPIRVTTL
jgi:hypothetical protein